MTKQSHTRFEIASVAQGDLATTNRGLLNDLLFRLKLCIVPSTIRFLLLDNVFMPEPFLLGSFTPSSTIIFFSYPVKYNMVGDFNFYNPS